MSMLSSIRRSRGRVVVGGGGGSPGLQNRWSDSATWGGALPSDDEDGDIVVAAGETLVVDTNTAVARSITVLGTLTFADNAAVGLTCRWIRVESTGRLLIGSEASPRALAARITFTGAKADAETAQKYTVELAQTTNNPVAQAWASTDVPPTNNETITVTYTSTTAMTVSSSAVGSLPNATAGTRYNNRIHFVAGNGTAGNSYQFTFYAQGERNSGVQRGLNVMGGQLLAYGAVPTTLRTRIDGHLATGAQSITMVDDITGWRVGDQIALGPTDYRANVSGAVQVLTIASVNAATRTITVAEEVAAPRWGVLQYVTDSGMSLTPGTLTNNGGDGSGFPASVWSAQPKVIDQRAWVSLLSRRIVFEGANDADWTTNGFGLHTMVMGRDAKFQLHGVELRRVGQRGTFGRYPIHAHAPSYNLPFGGNFPSDGAYLGAVDWDISGCSVRDSEQRGAVLHGVVGMKVRRSSFHNVRAHCVFFEDGAEWDNEITDNTIMDVKDLASASHALVSSDEPTSPGGSAGIWSSNPRNRITGNVVARVQGVGIWNAWSQPSVLGMMRHVTLPDAGIALRFIDGSGDLPARGQTVTQGGVSGVVMAAEVSSGLLADGSASGAIRVSTVSGGTFANGAIAAPGFGGTIATVYGRGGVEAIPNKMAFQPPGVWEDNEVIAAGRPNGEFAAAAIITGRSHTNNRGQGSDARVGFPETPFRLNFRIHKGEHGYLNRVEAPVYDRCVIADTRRGGFRGQAASVSLLGTIPAPLLVRESLNNATPVGGLVQGITSYHRLLNSKWGIYVGFTEAATSSAEGATTVPSMQAAIGTGDLYTGPLMDFSLFSGKFINSVPVFHLPPPHVGDGLPLGSRNHTFSGARMNMGGVGIPSGRTVIWDIPFMTYGLSDAVPVYTTYQDVVHTSTPFIGVSPLARNDVADSQHTAPLSAYRLNPADQTDVGSWIIADASAVNAYSGIGFHHFAAASGGQYRVTSPGRTVNWQAIGLDNAQAAGRSVVLAMQQDAAPTTVWVTTNWNSGHYAQSANGPATPSASATLVFLTAFADLATFLASSAAGYFYESEQSRIWVRHVGGTCAAPSTWVGGAEAQFTNRNTIVIKST